MLNRTYALEAAPHRPRTHCRVGPTLAGGRAPGTRQRGSGVPACLGGDRLLRPRSHSPMPATPDRRLKPGPVIAPGSLAPSGEAAQAQQRVRVGERSVPGATATPTLGTPRARRQAHAVTGRTPRAHAGAPARIAPAARPLPRCDLCLDASKATSMPDHLTADRLSADSRRKL